jgi:hypothetical protein
VSRQLGQTQYHQIDKVGGMDETSVTLQPVFAPMPVSMSGGHAGQDHTLNTVVADELAASAAIAGLVAASMSPIDRLYSMQSHYFY